MSPELTFRMACLPSMNTRFGEPMRVRFGKSFQLAKSQTRRIPASGKKEEV